MRFILLFIVFPFPFFGQTLSLQEVCTLPDAVKESSGLLYAESGRFWTHNDSGDEPFLYEIDSSGNLLRTIRVNNARHIDWEELTSDENQTIYVGDFGNNANKRQNLCIYKIPAPKDSSVRQVEAERISFRYPDQYAYPPADSLKTFDLEAFFYYKDSLYLFSKNRTNPPNGWTKRYRLPASPGNYVAELLDSFQTEQSNVIWSITSAAISPDGKQVVLLNADKLWWFHGFEGSDFFGGEMERFALASFSQKEAVCFQGNEQLWLSDERNLLGGGKLYKLPLSHLQDKQQQLHPPLAFELEILPEADRVQVRYQPPKAGKLRVQLYNIRARQLCLLGEGERAAAPQQFNLKGRQLCAGSYLLLLDYEGVTHCKRFVWP